MLGLFFVSYNSCENCGAVVVLSYTASRYFGVRLVYTQQSFHINYGDLSLVLVNTGNKLIIKIMKHVHNSGIYSGY